MRGAEVWKLAGHDLRQPLQAIRFMTELLISDRGEGQREQIGARLAMVTTSMESMVELLLELADFECGERIPAMQACRLQDCLKPVLESLEPVAKSFRCTIKSSVGDQFVVSELRLLSMSIKGMMLTALKQGDGDEVSVMSADGDSFVTLGVEFDCTSIQRAANRQMFIEIDIAGDEEKGAIAAPGLVAIRLFARHLRAQLQCETHDNRASLRLLIPKLEA
ncbi:MAG: histidine kinase dimerization/phospho-acceptor domain-containing protein [Hyphomicrobiaceae bacterium]